MIPCSASLALFPERSTNRLALADSTVPDVGTHTGAGPVAFFGGTTIKARIMPPDGKFVLSPSFTS